MTTLPLFYYPSTIAWVDDDQLFLEAAANALGNLHPLMMFTTPQECLAFFDHYTALLPAMNFLRGCTDHESYDIIDHMPVDLNVQTLVELRECRERNQEVSVIVVDYKMLDINGIELCRKLQSLPMKKILLTGEADEQKAVAAFNEGIIDCFISKASLTLTDDIEFHLKRLTQEYFCDRTRSLLAYLEADKHLPLSDQKFIDFFKSWCDIHFISEYYLLDKHGNFILFDKMGARSHFVIHTEQALNAFVELYNDDRETMSFTQAVAQRKKIPFFGEGKDSWQVEIPDWLECFHSPQVFQGRERYYWAVIK